MHSSHAPRLAHLMWQVGKPVHVNIRAAWIAATVTSITPQRIGVDYPADTGVRLGNTVAPWIVRPADGIELRPVHSLRVADQVVAYDGTPLTVAAPVWQGRDGLWQVEYTNGERASLPAGTVLRLIDPTPQVTVNGQPT